MRGALLALAALAVSVSSCHSELGASDNIPRTASESMRAIWVTRFDYRSQEDVVAIVRDCDSLGFDTILFQVRGNATAFYRSGYEPWAEELGGEDPGFDPLAVALREAHERGIALHAWVNVMPVWWGDIPPRNERQLYHAEPGWMWYDQHGQRQALCESFYVSLNPCLPDVRAYLSEVVRDLLGHYMVDGLHLDYVRFPNEAPAVPAGSGLDYPRDTRTLALYEEETGLHPDQALKVWDRWRADQVTQLVRDIRKVVDSTRPNVELSAAVGPEPEIARSEHFQDVEAWLRERLLDRVFPMNYSKDPETFARRVGIWTELADAHDVVMGVRVDLADSAFHTEQIREVRASFSGFSVFAYQTLFDSTNVQIAEQDPEAHAERQKRRAELGPFLRSL